MKRSTGTVDMALIDRLQYLYEARDPDRKLELNFGLSIKHGIPLNRIKRVDAENGLLEYFLD